MSKFSAFVSIFVLMVLASASDLPACAVCFGEADSDMVQGAKAGVFFLIAVIYSLLMGMAAIAGYWMYRAKKLAEAEAQAQALSPTASPQ